MADTIRIRPVPLDLEQLLDKLHGRTDNNKHYLVERRDEITSLYSEKFKDEEPIDTTCFGPVCYRKRNFLSV